MQAVAALLSSVLVVVCLLSYGRGQSATLTNILAQPCQLYSRTVSQYNSDVFTVNSNLSLCAGPEPNGTTAFRVLSLSKHKNSEDLIVFVARQGSGVISWNIPLQPQGFTFYFHHVNRTLCPLSLPGPPEEVTPPGDPSPSVLLYVDVFSSAQLPVSYNLTVIPVEDFVLSLDKQYSVTVGAATPHIRYFQLPRGIHQVSVQAKSESAKCAIISVQNNSCPANDLLRNARHKGIYQTMSTDAFLTVSEKHITNREFLLVVITTNFSVCHTGSYSPLIPLNGTEDDQFQQTINITIKTVTPISKHAAAIVVPVLIFLVLYVVAFLLLLIRCRWTPLCHWEWVGLRLPRQDQESHTQEEGRALVRKSRVDSYGTIAASTTSSTEVASSGSEGPSRRGVLNDTEAVPRDLEDSLTISAMYAEEKEIKVPRMCKKGMKSLDAQYRVYSWNTITVGIFYGLPAFQLVLSEQLILNVSGDQDYCYYNFKCAHSFGVLSAFNNVWSNVGYVLLGVLFLIITKFRQRQYQKEWNENRMYIKTHGVPQFFGIYYAMGFALILEGFMSALYHVCPSNANFQFDTAFMFIIGGLLLVKVFQNRHPDIHANGFIAFFSFAVVIFFTLLGIRFDEDNPLAVRLTLFFLVLVLVAAFFVSFYRFHHWKCECATLLSMFKFHCTTHPKTWIPKHKVRFIKLIIAFIINCIPAVIVVVSSVDIATAILAFFLVNVFFFFIAYIIQKWYYREPWTVLPMVLPVAMVVLWGTAFHYFFNYDSNWQTTAAESRSLNQPCIVGGFYDDHDVWHFLSACAMFFSFLFVLTIDDGLADRKREDIQVF